VKNVAIENHSYPAGRAGYDSIMADPFPIRPLSADEYAGFRRHDVGPRPVVPADLLGDTGYMPVTKITLSTAMRARDVSRPHAAHLAEAAEREESAARHAETSPPKPAPPVDQRGPAGPPAVPAPPRRRRRRGR
jgi:hypothetical protein